MASSAKPFKMHVTVTQHYEFEVWGDDKQEAFDKGTLIWRRAETVGQWELPDEETDYSVTPLSGEE